MKSIRGEETGVLMTALFEEANPAQLSTLRAPTVQIGFGELKAALEHLFHWKEKCHHPRAHEDTPWQKANTEALAALTLWFGKCDNLSLVPRALCCVQSSHLRAMGFMRRIVMSQICSCSNDAKKKKWPYQWLWTYCRSSSLFYFISILLKKLFINLLMKKS